MIIVHLLAISQCAVFTKQLHLVHDVPLIDRAWHTLHLLLLALLGRWRGLIGHLVVLNLLIEELDGESDELTVLPEGHNSSNISWVCLKAG